MAKARKFSSLRWVSARCSPGCIPHQCLAESRAAKVVVESGGFYNSCII